MRSRAFVIAAVAIALSAAGCGTDDKVDDDAVVDQPAPATTLAADQIWPTDLGGEHQRWTVQVVRTLKHDPAAFTQGLELTPHGILESTGRRGQSTLRLVDSTTGDIIDSRALDAALFGEGLTVVGDEALQLTWTAGTALRYDLTSFDLVATHSYDGEGWGLCLDGTGLWMSDGTSHLTRRDPVSFEPTGGVDVTRDGVAVDQLNELECVENRVIANVWRSDEIVVINPATGIVEATIDASPLVAAIGEVSADAVLNGIADLGDGTLLLGGKLWPRQFVVTLIPASS